MSRYLTTVRIQVALLLSFTMYVGTVHGEPIEDFILTMRAESRNGLSDSARALAASQWMDVNDWTTASRMHRIQLVELLDSDLLPDTKHFSVRWTGYLVPDQTGDYTLSLWRYYTSPTIITKIWVDDELVLDSVGDGDVQDKPFQTDEISLTRGERVPIQVEFSFDRSRPGARHARPNVVLSWQSDTLPRQIIPSSNLQPPDDFTEQGSNGLKGEYFSSSGFEGLVQTRLDPELGFLWHYFAILPEQVDRQREIAVAMIPEILESLNDPTIIGNEKSDAFWCVNDLEEVLTLEETLGILGVLKQYPERNAARSPREVYIGYTRFRYLPGGIAADLVIQWCKLNPLHESQFGTYPSYDKNEYYGNYDYFWRTANQMVVGREHHYLEDAVVEVDGSCNISLAKILSFAHKKSDTLDEWYAYLDSQIDAPLLSGNKKVSWLVARGFAEEMRMNGEPIPTAGMQWLERAYSEAESESMKRYVLGEMCCRLAAMKKGSDAEALLNERSSNHTNAQADADFARWRTAIDEVTQRHSDERTAAINSSRQAYIEDLQKRYDRAEARGDNNTATSITHLIEKAQSQMQD